MLKMMVVFFTGAVQNVKRILILGEVLRKENGLEERNKVFLVENYFRGASRSIR